MSEIIIFLNPSEKFGKLATNFSKTNYALCYDFVQVNFYTVGKYLERGYKPGQLLHSAKTLVQKIK